MYFRFCGLSADCAHLAKTSVLVRRGALWRHYAQFAPTAPESDGRVNSPPRGVTGAKSAIAGCRLLQYKPVSRFLLQDGVVDFEISMLSAIQSVFPNASVHCCRFHVGKHGGVT